MSFLSSDLYRDIDYYIVDQRKALISKCIIRVIDGILETSYYESRQDYWYLLAYSTVLTLFCFRHTKIVFAWPLRKTRLYNFDPVKPFLYSKSGVYRGIHYFSYFAENIDCGYSLEPPRRCGFNGYPQSMFWAEMWKISEFLSENFLFLVVKFSIYLNRRVFVMALLRRSKLAFFSVMIQCKTFCRKYLCKKKKKQQKKQKPFYCMFFVCLFFNPLYR